MPAFRRPPRSLGPGANAFRPSAELFGYTASEVVRCRTCGHGSLTQLPTTESVMDAYQQAEDPVSLREEEGQVETARRALTRLEKVVTPGPMVDLGCWTGSFLIAARARGWEPVGIEPSSWARQRATLRGLDVRPGDIFDTGLPMASFRLAVLCDVLEHTEEPVRSLTAVRDLLEDAGAVYITVPNAGSAVARILGRRWWSVLPMHLQYFTADSVSLALERSGFSVVSIRSHAKAFSARYYAERLAGYSSRLGSTAVGIVELVRMANRMVAPNFFDRLAVIATRSR